MDLSKLPKLSQTAEAAKKEGSPPHSPPVASPLPPPAPAQPVPDYATHSTPVLGAEVWISLVLGLVFVFLGFNFARYVITAATGQTFHTNVEWTEGAKAGQEVAYFDLQGYTAWTDASMFLFGVAMIADAAMLLVAAGSLARRTWLIWLGFGVTVLAVAINAVTALMLLSTGLLPLMSLIALAIGGYMAAYQWRLIPARRPPATGA